MKLNWLLRLMSLRKIPCLLMGLHLQIITIFSFQQLAAILAFPARLASL